LALQMVKLLQIIFQHAGKSRVGLGLIGRGLELASQLISPSHEPVLVFAVGPAGNLRRFALVVSDDGLLGESALSTSKPCLLLTQLPVPTHKFLSAPS
jgi:hypothetical protein